MQTTFTEDQLRDPATKRSNEILRACVHCGFCTATCPTYQVLGDELDSPRGRIYLIKDMMTGCAQKALNTDINDATIRLLTRLGAEVVVAEGAGCCGALTHHMGKTDESHATAAKNIAAWSAEMQGDGLDAIVINTSGCGTTIKDYGHMFRESDLADEAAAVSAIAMDVSEILMKLDLPEG